MQAARECVSCSYSALSNLPDPLGSFTVKYFWCTFPHKQNPVFWNHARGKTPPEETMGKKQSKNFLIPASQNWPRSGNTLPTCFDLCQEPHKRTFFSQREHLPGLWKSCVRQDPEVLPWYCLHLLSQSYPIYYPKAIFHCFFFLSLASLKTCVHRVPFRILSNYFRIIDINKKSFDLVFTLGTDLLHDSPSTFSQQVSITFKRCYPWSIISPSYNNINWLLLSSFPKFLVL